MEYSVLCYKKQFVSNKTECSWPASKEHWTSPNISLQSVSGKSQPRAGMSQTQWQVLPQTDLQHTLLRRGLRTGKRSCSCLPRHHRLAENDLIHVGWLPFTCAFFLSLLRDHIWQNDDHHLPSSKGLARHRLNRNRKSWVPGWHMFNDMPFRAVFFVLLTV